MLKSKLPKNLDGDLSFLFLVFLNKKILRKKISKLKNSKLFFFFSKVFFKFRK